MAIATRAAETTWSADLATGHGVVQADSGGFDGLDVTWASRTEAPDRKTSPEGSVRRRIPRASRWRSRSSSRRPRRRRGSCR
jgi:hypothetical protein